MLKHLALISLFATPAFAEMPGDWAQCEFYWWQRNQIFANAGHCFTSPLGKAMFDNTGCVPGDTPLDSRDSAYVRAIRAEEAALDCAVDTSRTTPLDIPDVEYHRDFPYFGPDEGPSSCIGWVGPAFTLHSDPRPDAPVTGTVMPGDDIAVTVDTPGAGGTWFYYFHWIDGEMRDDGWASRDLDWDLCTSNAG